MTSGAKRARREVLEKSAPPERWTTPLAGDLAKAFERRQLQARYVPVIDLDIHALSAVEAHLFWQHPQRGLMTELDIYTATQDHPELGAALLEFLLEQSCSFLKEQVESPIPFGAGDRPGHARADRRVGASRRDRSRSDHRQPWRLTG